MRLLFSCQPSIANLDEFRVLQEAQQTEQKLRGGYYTPNDLAAFCSAWVLESGASEIMEPSCGDGAFIEAIMGAKRPANLAFKAFEICPEEAAKARSRAQRLTFGAAKAEVTEGDFLEWAIRQLLKNCPVTDAVVGNPPFIRYQYLPPVFQQRSEQVFEILRLPFTKHTNAWVPFVLASIALLKPSGRLAMVIPSEIVHVMHAAPLRSFLTRQCDRIAILDPTEIWFTDTLQGAVILLAEKAEVPTRPKGRLTILPVSGRDFAQQPAEALLRTATWQSAGAIDGKWTQAVLSVRARAFGRNPPTTGHSPACAGGGCGRGHRHRGEQVFSRQR